MHDTHGTGMPEGKLLKEHCRALAPRLGHVLLFLLKEQGYIQLKEETLTIPEANPFAVLSGLASKLRTVRWYVPGEHVQLQHLVVDDEAALLRPAGAMVVVLSCMHQNTMYGRRGGGGGGQSDAPHSYGTGGAGPVDGRAAC